jgi:hypothetical protein
VGGGVSGRNVGGVVSVGSCCCCRKPVGDPVGDDVETAAELEGVVVVAIFGDMVETVSTDIGVGLPLVAVALLLLLPVFDT